MNKFLKKSYFVLIVVSAMTLAACSDKDNNEKKSSLALSNGTSIDENSAKAISIENEEIVNISKSNGNKIDIGTKIENASNFDISKVIINYEEYDLNKNIISKSQSFLDITLNPKETAYIGFSHVKDTDSLRITSYSYITQNQFISVELKNDKVAISKNVTKTEDSKDYEVLLMTNPIKNQNSSNINSFKMKFKNTSSKDIGNITLKIGELNREGEYIIVNDIPVYDILKPKDNMEIDIPVSQDTNQIELIGYSYNDIKDNYNVKIDLKTHMVEINK